MQKEIMSDWVKGAITLSWVKDGMWMPFAKKSNLVTYGGADIAAASLAGRLGVNGMYVGYANDSGAVKYTPDAANDAAYYAVEETDRGLVRVSTLGEPILESTSGEYSGNKISFLAVTDGAAFFPATPLTDSVSEMYHSALVAMDPDSPENQSLDKIFSCSDFSVPVTKIAGAQLGIRWDLVFTKP